jgi:Serine/threonine protein kinase
MSFTSPANLNDLINASKIQANSANRLKQNTDAYVGTIINGEYAVLEVIGEGGMARVYKAKQISVDRFVALKILSTEEPESVARFAREVRIHGRLKHKNIVQALDCICDTNTGKTLFVMEYLNGLTLGELIRDTGTGVHNEQDVFSILTQLCDALDHAHNRGIIHRDLKPNNIVLLQESENLVVKSGGFRNRSRARGHAATDPSRRRRWFSGIHESGAL